MKFLFRMAQFHDKRVVCFNHQMTEFSEAYTITAGLLMARHEFLDGWFGADFRGNLALTTDEITRKFLRTIYAMNLEQAEAIESMFLLEAVEKAVDYLEQICGGPKAFRAL